jgi:heme-degrading monooxygenase HmoA
MHNVKYVKRNDVRLKSGKTGEFNRILLQFLGNLEGKVKGLKGSVVMNHTSDENEIIVLTLWETEYDMEVFYHPSNMAFSAMLLTEHHHYLRANPKELTMQYHFSEYDVRRLTHTRTEGLLFMIVEADALSTPE